MAPMSKLATFGALLAIVLLVTDETYASLAVGRQNGLMRPGRSLAVGRTFRPGRSLASGRPFFRPGKRADEEQNNSCSPDIIDEYTGELIEVVKKMVDFERHCGYEENEAPASNQPAHKSA